MLGLVLRTLLCEALLGIKEPASAKKELGEARARLKASRLPEGFKETMAEDFAALEEEIAKEERAGGGK